MVDALFVCVNYNNSKETINYIIHLNQCLNEKQFNIVVCDNSESKCEFDNLSKFIKNYHIKNIYLTKSKKNLGYFTGMQFAINFYVNNFSDIPSIIYICNTDIIIKTKNIIEISKNIFKKDNILSIAPNIVLAKQLKPQNPFKIKKPTYKKLKFLEKVYSNQVLNNTYSLAYKLKRKLIKNSITDSSTCTIYAPHGSFIIIKKEFFKLGGTLNYPGFLFGEELFLAEQILKLNKKVIYLKDINIIHNENCVTKLIESSKKRLLKLNSTKYLEKYLYNIR